MLGSADIKEVSYEIQCNDIPDAGVNRTVEDALDMTQVLTYIINLEKRIPQK